MEMLNPPFWKKPKGYTNGISATGRLVFTAGQVGWDENEIMKAGFIPQVRQALENTVAILKLADARPEHIVRMTWYIIDKTAYLDNRAELGRVYRSVIGRHYPAMAMVQVAGLVEAGGMVEIETTAVVPR